MIVAAQKEVADQSVDFIDAVFGSSGYLAQRFAGYRVRDGQVALAQAVDSAIQNRDGKRHLIAEGPTGTGKSLAYCVPAIYNTVGKLNESGEPCRALIVTGNIALQEQLANKDLPLLQQILPVKFNFALLKGMQNYLCLDQDDTTRGETQLNVKLPIYRPEDVQEYDDILEWALKTTTGDVSELPFVPASHVWQKFSVSSEDCLRSKCDWAQECFPMKAQAHARQSQVIVTNYHMLFAHLKVRMMTGGIVGILPSFDYLICDEAHKAADIAREFFGSQLSWSGLKKLLRRIEYDEKRGRKKRFQDEAALNAAATGIDREALTSLEHEADLFFGDLTRYMKSKDYKIRLKKKDPVDSSFILTELALVRKNVSKLSTSLGNADSDQPTTELERAAAARKKELDLSYSKLGEAISVIKRAMNLGHEPEPEVDPFDLSEELSTAVSDADNSKPKSVFFLEEDHQQRAVLREKMIDVAGIIRSEVFDSTQSVVITSATLSTGGKFDYIRGELGAPRAETAEMIAETPFDYRNQSLLIVPDKDTICMPNGPEAEQFSIKIPELAHEVIMAAKGRTLCLFTSYKNLKNTAKYLQQRKLPYKLLIQNDKPRTQLIEEFKANESSVLLGTESFWAGVDVPGPALSCLFIDKIPFPTPEDPILDALSEVDDRSFFTFSIPRAMIMLSQGVGRLIRSVSDVGVVVIGDRRLVEKGYGSGFLKSLPPMSRTRKMTAIAEFLEEK